MLGSLKITTAILICSTFIFKLLFINISSIPSFGDQQKSELIKTDFSSGTKKNKTTEVTSDLKDCGYSITEDCEEDSNDDQLKLNSFFLVQILYSLSADNVEYNLKKVSSLCTCFSYASSCKYLAFQSFRI